MLARRHSPGSKVIDPPRRVSTDSPAAPLLLHALLASIVCHIRRPTSHCNLLALNNLALVVCLVISSLSWVSGCNQLSSRTAAHLCFGTTARIAMFTPASQQWLADQRGVPRRRHLEDTQSADLSGHQHSRRILHGRGCLQVADNDRIGPQGLQETAPSVMSYLGIFQLIIVSHVFSPVTL